MTEDEKTSARNEIAELMQRYARASDFNDREAYAMLYLEDGVLDLPDGQQHKGRDALRSTPKPQGVKRRHYFMPPVLEFGADGEATGHGYCVVFNFDEATNKAGPPRSIDYQTTYRHTAEGWRIANHRVRPSFGG